MQELDSNTRDRLFENERPSDEAFPSPRPDSDPWWTQLKFDELGTKLDYQGELWAAEELATADVTLAQYAADLLKHKRGGADVNNRACALVYADPANSREALEELKRHPGSPKAERNLEILEHAEPAPEVAAEW